MRRSLCLTSAILAAALVLAWSALAPVRAQAIQGGAPEAPAAKSRLHTVFEVYASGLAL